MNNQSSQPLGQILIEAGLISINQIQIALREQEETGLTIEEILVAHGWIKQTTADFFVKQWCSLLSEIDKKPLVSYFQQADLLNNKQIKALIRLQKLKRQKVRFHHLAVEQGYLKQKTVDFFLAYLFKIHDAKSISATKTYELLIPTCVQRRNFEESPPIRIFYSSSTFGSNHPHGRKLRFRTQVGIKNYSQGIKDFSGSDLRKAEIISVSLKDIVLDGSNLSRVDLSQANLSHSSLIGANLNLANLTKAILTEVNFTNSCLTQANLREAHLEKANFSSAILHGVDFQSSHLAQANFVGADLTQARLPLDYTDEVYYDEYTIFAQDFNPEIRGWKKVRVQSHNYKI